MDNEEQDDSMELLITNVRERRSLWHPKQQNIPGIKKTQQRMWEEVAQLHNSSVEVVKKKWQNLRSGFTKRIQKIPKNEKKQFTIEPQNFRCSWRYYHLLLFLVNPEHVAPPPIAKTKREKRKSDSVITVDQKRLRLNEHFTNVDNHIATSSSVYVEQNIPQLLNTLNTSNSKDNLASGEIENDVTDQASIEITPDLPMGNSYDSDAYFLMSFHEFLQSLEPSQKLRVRAAISFAISSIIQSEIGNSSEN